MSNQENHVSAQAEVQKQFTAEFKAFMDRWGAEMEIVNHWEGYAECGEDNRMIVNIPAIYDAEHNCVRPCTEIDFGKGVYS